MRTRVRSVLEDSLDSVQRTRHPARSRNEKDLAPLLHAALRETNRETWKPFRQAFYAALPCCDLLIWWARPSA
jgi:hypothetical protein